MKKNFLEERGSMAVYVTIVLFAFMLILSAIYMSATSTKKTELQTIVKIKQSYEIGSEDIEKIYQNQLERLESQD